LQLLENHFEDIPEMLAIGSNDSAVN
jgi:hypothetical protein